MQEIGFSHAIAVRVEPELEQPVAHRTAASRTLRVSLRALRSGTEIAFIPANIAEARKSRTRGKAGRDIARSYDRSPPQAANRAHKDVHGIHSALAARCSTLRGSTFGTTVGIIGAIAFRMTTWRVTKLCARAAREKSA